MEQTRKKHRRWFRLNLRTLLVLVTIACVFIGTYLNRVVTQREAVAVLTAHGAFVLYEHDPDLILADPFSVGGTKQASDDLTWKQWLVEKLGMDFFYNVERVEVSDANEKMLNAIGRLRSLKDLIVLDSNSENLIELVNLKKLERLEISQDETLSNLDGLQKMRQLKPSCSFEAPALTRH